MLGQNTSAHFLQKVGQITWVGQITFLVGQNTWASPKVGGRIPGRGQKWGRIPGRGQKWGRLPGMIFLVFRPALLPRCRITLGAAEEEKRGKQPLNSPPPATQRDEIGMVPPRRAPARRTGSPFADGYGPESRGGAHADPSPAAAMKSRNVSQPAGRPPKRFLRPGILPPTFGDAQVFCPTRKVICPPR